VTAQLVLAVVGSLGRRCGDRLRKVRLTRLTFPVPNIAWQALACRTIRALDVDSTLDDIYGPLAVLGRGIL
jgi:hypothetical protein